MVIGSSTASMPTKCIDQIPPPSAKAACATRALRRPADRSRRFEVRRRLVNAAMMATASDAITSAGE